MAVEIERKFLVADDGWRDLATGMDYRQGYLNTAKERTVRVRAAGETGYLTVKGITVGVSRTEFEYEIPLADANAMLDALCERPLIQKTRFKIPDKGLIWEVDVFAGDNAGLVTAEVELIDEAQEISPPDWIGREVTDDPRYSNSSLVTRPFNTW